MFRIGGQYFPRETLVLAGTESLLLLFSLISATALRFLDWGATQDYLWRANTGLRFLLVIGICQIASYYTDLYDLQVVRTRSVLLVHTFRALGSALLVLALLYYVFPSLRLERGILALLAPIGISVMVGWRFALDVSQSFSKAAERLIVLGTGEQGISLTREILRRPELMYRVVGFLDEKGENIGKSLVNPGIVAGVAELNEVIERERIDRVVISVAERRGVMSIRELVNLKVRGIPIEDAHSFYERITGRIMLEHLRPSWLILSDGFRKSNFLLAAKRAIDIVVSALLLVLTAPIAMLTALAIFIESGGPVLFRQQRLGLCGRPFQMLKFRSMRVGSEKGKPTWTADGDPRITQVGKFIRKFRFDELPQLINVLRGEMSLVGPRPEVPYFCELLAQEIPYYNQRHSVRPGLTGWAQVKYQYGASLEEAKVKFEFDLFYVKNLSVLLDLVIIFETAKVVLWGRGAK